MNSMDADTIQKVSKWYQDARSITSARRALAASSSSGSSGSSNSGGSGSGSGSGNGSSVNIEGLARERRAMMRRLGVR